LDLGIKTQAYKAQLDVLFCWWVTSRRQVRKKQKRVRHSLDQRQKELTIPQTSHRGRYRQLFCFDMASSTAEGNRNLAHHAKASPPHLINKKKQRRISMREDRSRKRLVERKEKKTDRGFALHKKNRASEPSALIKKYGTRREANRRHFRKGVGSDGE